MSQTEKQRVAVFSMSASFGMAAAKLAAGLATGSLGILSEAIHSAIDFGATIVTWFAVRWSALPPDDDHTYGHAKFESVAALIETALLFATTAWIAREALLRLLGEPSHVEVTWWSAAIIVASVVIDFNRSRALSRVARRTSSEALAADALHFSSDMWSSVAVLCGLAGVWLGFALADAVAALAVAVFIAHAGWELGRQTLATLLDTAPEGATERARRIVLAHHGILALTRLRIRPAGPTLFISVVVDVPRTMPVEAMIALKESIESDLIKAFPQADPTVTANPVALDSESVFQKVMLIASHRNLAVHHVTVQKLGERLAVSFDLEVDGAIPLSQAHETATELEAAIRRELGSDVEVESHIEPQPVHLLAGSDAPPALRKRIVAALSELAEAEPRLKDVHNVRIRQTDDGIFVHYHCRFDGAATVDEVHAAVDRVENGLQERFPDIRRVIAHAEPVGVPNHAL